jgi:hypothetical protein
MPATILEENCFTYGKQTKLNRLTQQANSPEKLACGQFPGDRSVRLKLNLDIFNIISTMYI